MPRPTVGPVNRAKVPHDFSVLFNPIEGVGGDDHIGCIVDHDLPVPGIEHEPVMILVFGQVAVVVKSQGRCPGAAGDLI